MRGAYAISAFDIRSAGTQNYGSFTEKCHNLRGFLFIAQIANKLYIKMKIPFELKVESKWPSACSCTISSCSCNHIIVLHNMYKQLKLVHIQTILEITTCWITFLIGYICSLFATLKRWNAIPPAGQRGIFANCFLFYLLFLKILYFLHPTKQTKLTKKNASSSFAARMSRAPNGNIITYQCFDRVYNNDQTIHSRIALFIFGVGVARPRWRLMWLSNMIY